MRIATVRADGVDHLAVADGDGFRRLDGHDDLAALLRAGIDPQQLSLGEPLQGDLAAPLRPGKVADFVVLSADPTAVEPHRIKDIVVEATYIGGKKVYDHAEVD